jgi:hypothetical protein
MDRMRTIRGLLATAALGILLVGCSAGTVPPEAAKSAEAQQLATKLQAALAAAGLPQPDAGVLAVLYGTDGSVSCENAGDVTHVDGLALFGNPSHVRRVAVDPTVVTFDEAVVSTYCPDRLDALRKTFADQTTPAQTIP